MRAETISTLLAALLLGIVAPAAADYPERALTIVVAYPAGGMVDIVARPMADSMKKTFTKGVAAAATILILAAAALFGPPLVRLVRGRRLA